MVKSWHDHIKAALEYSDGRYSFADVHERIMNHTADLWVAEDSAAVTWLESYPQKDVLVVAFAGGDLREMRDLLPQVEAYAKDAGCKDIVIYGRPGWSRALEGYEMVSCQARKVL